jgi:hypothetical protein
MLKVHSLFQDVGFDAVATANMGAAFDTAWQILKTRDPLLANGPYTTSVREALARQIIEFAKTGLTDAGKLAEAAIASMRV